MFGREIDKEWIKTMMANFGRRVTVEIITELYHVSPRKAEKAVNGAMAIAPEQGDGAADRIMEDLGIC